MWSYYGSKCKIANKYPRPTTGRIIEPFAGAAWYSATNATVETKVLLCDLSPVICGIWDWLINSATEEMILSNKDFYFGQDIRDFLPSGPHRDLVGFCINRGMVSPCHKVTRWSCQSKKNPLYASTVEFRLKNIASNLHRIKKWRVVQSSYLNLDNLEATWFIDPPYQNGGERYVFCEVNYKELGDWCRSRNGEVIVCESSGADWLPFEEFVTQTGQKKKCSEVVWLKGFEQTRRLRNDRTKVSTDFENLQGQRSCGWRRGRERTD